MNDLTKDSDRLIQEGRILRDDNRTGGRHRQTVSIGAGSARIKRKSWLKRVRNIVIALFGIWVAAGLAGMIIGGIGFAGVMAVIVAAVVAIAVLGNYPKAKAPKLPDLARTQDAKQLVARTELWLEHQRPALPPPAVKIVEGMGVQLDALGLQLEGVDPMHPSAREVRKLVGEHLPEMIDSYHKIPAHLRAEERGGRTPDDQLTDGLGKISDEIDSVTRQLADGALDELAIKHRYLDYRYGSGVEGSAQDALTADPQIEQGKEDS